jgi:hypothetical protein
MPHRPIARPERDRVEIHDVRVIVEEILRHNPSLANELRLSLARRTDLRPIGDDLPAMTPQDQYVRSRALEILDQAAGK